ncbi:MAG: hypothetical protein ABF651_09410 [Sporolactobacillus sp.]
MEDNWNNLDNAALIFPSAAKKADTQVFRISCTLHAQIDPSILQAALDQTLQIFTFYQSIMKRGFFWYYLERTDTKPLVHEEDRQPCATLYSKKRENLLFDVSYYQKRINLEVFHVLSDGTGAMHFLRTLLNKYLSQRYHMDEPFLDYDASAVQMSDDSFRMYYAGKQHLSHTGRSGHKFACRLHGRRYPENQLKIINGRIALQPLLQAAHRYHTTLTVFLCACLIDAINASVPARSKRRPIVLNLPVNLRSHFPSASARNFFSVLLISYDCRHDHPSFEEILNKVENDLKAGLSKENLAGSIDTYSAVEHNFFARIVPLFIKDFALKTAFDYSSHLETAGFSNLGIISMPDEFEPYIRSFDLCFGTNGLQVCMCSYQKHLSVSFSSPFVSSEIQRRFFRALTSLDAEVEITTNKVGNGEDDA